MSEIVLSPEQVSVLSSADGLVAIRRPDGSFVGWVSPKSRFIIPTVCPFTPEEIAKAEAEAAGPGPFRTTAEVLARLRALDQSQP